MFERFDEDVRLLIASASQDAALAGATTVEPEHLLVGLVSAGGRSGAGGVLRAHGVTRNGLLEAIRGSDAGVSASDTDALASLGIDVRAVEAAADRTFGPGALRRAGVRPARGTVRLGANTKTALVAALDEALGARSRRISSLHLLLALARDPVGRCSRLLAGFGLDYDTIRDEADRAA